MARPVKTVPIQLDAIDLAVQDSRERMAQGDVAAARLILERFRDGNDAVPILVLSGLDDERSGLSRAGGVGRVRGGGARENGEGEGRGHPEEETGAQPSDVSGDGRTGGGLFEGVRQYGVWGRHERRLSVSSSATAYRVS